ncbi:MAG: hypothetical protein ACYTFA_00375 [Planctomycetota bacterium]
MKIVIAQSDVVTAYGWGMEIRLVYPRWPKLRNGPESHLPPHGPVFFAAAPPADVHVGFFDENVREVGFSDQCDPVCISCMLTCQMPRALQIADRFQPVYDYQHDFPDTRLIGRARRKWNRKASPTA